MLSVSPEIILSSMLVAHTPSSEGCSRREEKPKEKLPKIFYLHCVQLSKCTVDMITNVKYYSELCVDFSALRQRS